MKTLDAILKKSVLSKLTKTNSVSLPELFRLVSLYMKEFPTKMKVVAPAFPVGDFVAFDFIDLMKFFFHHCSHHEIFSCIVVEVIRLRGNLITVVSTICFLSTFVRL